MLHGTFLFFLNDTVDEDELVSDSLAYALIAIWSMPVPAAKYPKLREWYDNHPALDFASKILHNSVAQLSELHDVHRLASLLHTPRGLAQSDHHSDRDAMSLLESLEAAAGEMLRYRMKLCGMVRHGQDHPRLVVVPTTTQGTCCVARLQSCSLPVVLRLENEDRYSLVGEAVGDIVDGERKEQREDDDDDDGSSVDSSATISSSDEHGCWFGLSRNHWTELELR